jgi:tripeptide aminopeptidase
MKNTVQTSDTQADSPATLEEIIGLLPYLRDAGQAVREILLANLVMLGEIPAPTFSEHRRVEFMQNRFVESGLQDASADEIGNALGVLPGTVGDRSILLAAQLDTIFPATFDHTITLQPDQAIGPGVGTNALGLATVVTLPLIMNLLDIPLSANLVLMGACRSRGRGDLEGLRFFLANTRIPLSAAISVEGFPLGGLSYDAIGSIRGEIVCEVPEEYDWTRFGAVGAIVTMNEVINRILEIPLPRRPRSSIVLGSIQGGQGYDTIATRSDLHFEIRTESESLGQELCRQLGDIVAEVSAHTGGEVSLDIFSRRRPGGISFKHPLARVGRQVLKLLDIVVRRSPSISELAAFIEHGIPAISIGITRGERLEEPVERVMIEPIFTGLAQLLGLLLAIDLGFCCED